MNKESLNIDDIIEDIHEAGGLAFLAHAYEYQFENIVQEIEKIINKYSQELDDDMIGEYDDLKGKIEKL